MSYLSLKEAAASSILSSRWAHLWMFTTRLNFNAFETLCRVRYKRSLLKKERTKYVKWANHVLRLHKGSMLEEFRIWFDLSKVYRRHVDRWLEFALTRHVQRLEFNFLYNGICRFYEHCYSFPSKMIAESSNSPPYAAYVGFKSLKEVCLRSVNVSGETVEYFLSNCPLLERMVVQGSGLLLNLEVGDTSRMLRHLEIRNCLDLETVKIANTNLVSLKFLGYAELTLLNNPLLVHAHLGYCVLVNAVLAEPASFLSRLEILTLDVFGKDKMKLEEFPGLPKLKKLVIKVVKMQDHRLLGFSGLLNGCPCLEKFVLEYVDFQHLIETIEVRKPAWRPHHNLKEVELRGYCGNPSDVEVVMYFAQNALLLQQLIIDPRQQQFPDPLKPVDDKLIKIEEAARDHAELNIRQIVPPNVRVLIL